MPYVACGFFWSALCLRFIHTVVYSCSFFIFIFIQYSIVWSFYNLSILLVMGIWVIYILRRLEKVLLQTFSNMSFTAHTHAFLLSTHLGGEWLNHRVCVCSALGDNAKQFYKVVVPIPPLEVHRSSRFSTCSPRLHISLSTLKKGRLPWI